MAAASIRFSKVYVLEKSGGHWLLQVGADSEEVADRGQNCFGDLKRIAVLYDTACWGGDHVGAGCRGLFLSPFNRNEGSWNWGPEYYVARWYGNLRTSAA